MKIVIVLGVLIALGVSGCNPFYVIQAGITQSEILINRRPIEEVLSDPATDPEIARKLQLVEKVRGFATKIALEPGGTFTSYSALDRDILAWIVLAAKPDSFTLYTWWFPIVGSVPYKGYFSPQSAQCAANRLKAKGYETLVRGTEAFSTLGWFNDPVMTPMLKNEDYRIVESVLHEILHTTLWVPNFVAFNESAANFVGHRGAVSYFESQQLPTEAATKSLETAFDVSRTLAVLVPELQQLYQSDHTRDEKLALREEVFHRYIDPLRQRNPELRILKRAHNAELMQLGLYYSKLDLFQQLWDKGAGSWSAFIEQLRLIAAASEEQAKDPFELLNEHLVKGSNASL